MLSCWREDHGQEWRRLDYQYVFRWRDPRASGVTAYDASKGGIEALTRALALDLGPYNVRVNAIMPGSIDTEGLDLEGRKLRGENVPLERIGEPADMAGPAVFLASDDSAYVTGDVLRVDGGMLAQQRSATVDIQPPSCFPTIAEIQ